MKIITVNREFGSGGREIGKRLADTMGFAYCDREIITIIAHELSMDESYIERVTDRSVLARYPLTFSRTLQQMPTFSINDSYLLAKQHTVIKELAAKGDCVIVGQGAATILDEYHPFKLFVYADMSAKVARCRTRAAADESLTDRELARKINEIDKARADNFSLVSSSAWKDMHSYTLCINTTGVDLKFCVSAIAVYANTWFERNPA
jgi:cytidylate kinase